MISTLMILLSATLAAEASPTFTRDVAPIIFNKCTECHRPGEATPFPLQTFEDVQRRAKLIAHVTAAGVMPPWKAARGKHAFVNERGLTKEEISTIQSWAELGAPQGDPKDLPSLPQFPEGWRLGEPDLVIRMTESFTVPADGPDIYINFPVAIPPLPAGKYLKAIEFRPRARTTAHHTLYALDTTGVSVELDAEDPGYGYRGMTPQLRRSRIGGWAVGGLPLPFPEGVALEIPNGSYLVLEAHFHPTGTEETEQATVGLHLTDDAPTRQLVHLPVPFAFGAGMDIDIPAGEASYEVREEFTIPNDVELVSLMPHAHYICKEMRATATLPGGEKVELIHIPDWDFAWQEQYEYREPVFLPAGSVVETWFRYDNSAENPRNPHNPPQRVLWGPESTDEMASIAMNVIPKKNEEAAALQAAVETYARESIESANFDNLRIVMQKQMVARFDKDGDGALNISERLQAMARARKRMARAESGDLDLAKILFQKVGAQLLGTE